MAKKQQTPARFDRAAFLSAATTLLEDVVPSGPLGLGDVPIRELTAAQRLEAVEVAKVFDADGEEVTLPDGSAKLDTARYWAALIVGAVIDPATCYGTGFMDGKPVFLDGAGALLLQPDDIFTLAEQGKEVLRVLAQHIMNLSWLTKSDMFRFSPKADDRQPAQGASAEPAEPGTVPQGMDDGDDGAVLGAG